MKKSLMAVVVLFVAAQIALSQNWVMTDMGTNDWSSVALSANGSTLIAGQWTGYLGVSTNYGAAWTTNVMTNGYWTSVASSADGTKLLAAAANVDGAHPSGVFLSTNSGASWISNSLPPYYWGSVAISADGNTLAAVAPIVSGSSYTAVCAVFCSTNAGVNWASNSLNFTPSPAGPGAVNVAMSADGRKIFVLAPPQVCYSTNSGASWLLMTNAPTLNAWVSPSQYIASSADGTKLVMCAEDAYDSLYFIYTSTNSGETWNLTPLPGGTWTFVASSGDGNTLMVSGYGLDQPSSLCISTDSGASWTTNIVAGANWTGTACSADGGTLIAAAGSTGSVTNFNLNGPVYVSQSIQPPLLTLASASPGNGNANGNDLQLSWLIPSTGFQLEQSVDLNNWTIVTNEPVLNLGNLNEQIVVSPTNGAGFYRLVH